MTAAEVRVEHDGTMEVAREIGALLAVIGMENLPQFLRDKLARCQTGDLIRITGEIESNEPGVSVFLAVPSYTALTLLADLRIRAGTSLLALP